MNSRTCQPCRRPGTPHRRLRPASHSYLDANRQTAVLGVIAALIGILWLTNAWLVRLLG